MLRRLVETSQYTGAQHAHLASKHGVRLSVGRRGPCWDNAVAESFFATIKPNSSTGKPGPPRATARQAIFEYIDGPRSPPPVLARLPRPAVGCRDVGRHRPSSPSKTWGSWCSASCRSLTGVADRVETVLRAVSDNA
ncbi:hypothetical protein GCM10022255_068360 [Dactylosporangium darangshiense]|uniref:Integrase catalytic domain-containing protein n=1 Tax=Dactylosporangium darangshiense TaxID=579108 RepID=A0ABP8DHZ4_9ACTN